MATGAPLSRNAASSPPKPAPTITTRCNGCACAVVIGGFRFQISPSRLMYALDAAVQGRLPVVPAFEPGPTLRALSFSRESRNLPLSLTSVVIGPGSEAGTTMVRQSTAILHTPKPAL